MKSSTWIGGILALSLCACGEPKGYVIEGEVTGFPDSTMLCLMTTSEAGAVSDTTWIVNGKFRYEGNFPSEPQSVYLINQQMKYLYLFIGNERVKIQGDITEFPLRMTVSGSKFHDQWKDYADRILPYALQQDSLRDLYVSAQQSLHQDGEEGKNIRAELSRIQQKIDSIETDYLFQRTNTYPSLSFLRYRMFNYPKDTVQMLFDRMSAELQEKPMAESIRIFLAADLVEVGDPFCDFEAEDQHGNQTRLSDWIGKDGKYVLLDFTINGCGPCAMAAKEMRQMVDTYSDSLQIISFSVDPSREVWQEALQRDSVCWTSLWNEDYIKRQTVFITYQVRGFPKFIVINPQGIIVDQWFGYGPGTFEEKIGRFKNK